MHWYNWAATWVPIGLSASMVVIQIFDLWWHIKKPPRHSRKKRQAQKSAKP